MEGISRQNMDIVVVFHNAGTYCIQKDAAYQEKYGMKNPNLSIFDQLARAGVKFYVCGQSTVKRKVNPSDIVPEVAMATSYMTIFTTLQLKGYSVLHL
jgi:intracellular sulfur oxidation DsrE/DsrF family protein